MLLLMMVTDNLTDCSLQSRGGLGEYTSNPKVPLAGGTLGLLPQKKAGC